MKNSCERNKWNIDMIPRKNNRQGPNLGAHLYALPVTTREWGNKYQQKTAPHHLSLPWLRRSGLFGRPKKSEMGRVTAVDVGLPQSVD